MSCSIVRLRALPIVLVVATVVATIVASAAASVPAARDEAAAEDQFISWVRDTSVRLENPAPGMAAHVDLSFLDEALEGKRIVYLGVSDHWVHEKYDYRLLIIRYLFEKGWRHIGMEMGYSDGKRIDRYLETGDDAHLERVALYGYKGDMRDDRDDVPKHFPGMLNPRFRRAFLSEERRFLGRLRELNASLPPGRPRLRWFGFDLTLMPGGDHADAVNLVEGHESEPVVREVLRRLERAPGETKVQEAERLREALAYIHDHLATVQGILGRSRTTELTRSIRSLADSYLFCEAAAAGPRSMNWFVGLQKREQAMIALADELLDGLPPSEKIILMGHNLHLNKDSEHILLGPVGSPAPRLWTSLGTHLARELPNEIYAIWMMYDRGRHGAVLLEEGVEEVGTDSTRIEHTFARLGTSFFLPLGSGDPRESYLDVDRNFNQNGATASGVLTLLSDAVFFVPVVKELEER